MPHADLLAALLPPVSYAPSGPHLAASLTMEGRELDRVQAGGETCRRFRAGQSVAGEALRTWGDSLLECIINWRKPAHTVALVAYREA